MENNHEILKKIQSNQPELLIEVVQEIKENGDLSIAQMLLENLSKIQDARTKTTLINLLSDIKKNAFKEILIHQLKTTTEVSTKSELLRIVWESALNYSEYLSVFLEIIQKEEFIVAFEASTVIENMLPHFTPEQHRQLHQFIQSCPADKHFLIENIHAEMGCCEND